MLGRFKVRVPARVVGMHDLEVIVVFEAEINAVKALLRQQLRQEGQPHVLIVQTTVPQEPLLLVAGEHHKLAACPLDEGSKPLGAGLSDEPKALLGILLCHRVEMVDDDRQDRGGERDNEKQQGDHGPVLESEFPV